MTSGKSIILFSDGTGNSSGKLFKTNVWRLYEAVDLGPNAQGRDLQIAYYDNGVGTQGFRPLAMLAGIFGFGLKRAILRLYRYACRNYRDGDRIYAFGFSRGAFTIRLVVGLIAQEGLVRYETEEELKRRSVDAFRRFSRRNDPNVFPVYAWIGRAVRNFVVAVKRLQMSSQDAAPSPHRPDIAFVGVWDTVAAYGGPIVELTRAIDNWIWPLSMTDYQLSPRVKQARHALALDDVRDSFHPLLWDEYKESMRADHAGRRRDALLAAAARKESAGAAERAAGLRLAALRQECRRHDFTTRIQQLWFAGMHADVGGGYPDESLSYVSLRWMLEEAEKCGLRLLPDHRARIVEGANAFGPLHNSREGFGAYYRYQPRKITAYLHPAGEPSDRAAHRVVRETLLLRDPTLGEQEYRPQGMLMTCKVHDSVVARITSGTDDYAPYTLPDTFDIVPEATDTDDPQRTYDLARWQNIAANNVVDERGVSPRGDRQEEIWSVVFRRRVTYFATVLASLVLLLSPWWAPSAAYPAPPDGRWIGFTDLVRSLIPGFAGPWIDALTISPFLVVANIIAILLLLRRGRSLEGRIASETRGLWRSAMAGTVQRLGQSGALRGFRNSYAYQWVGQQLKWHVLPNLLGFFIAIVLIPLALLAIGTQVELAFKERRICAASGEPGPLLTGSVSFTLRTDALCTGSGIRISKDSDYQVDVAVTEPWSDGGHPADPRGLSALDLGWIAGPLGAPLRRKIGANYLELVYEVRPIGTRGGRIATMHMERFDLQRVGPGRFRARFTAPESGRLFLFANDSVLPRATCFFYTWAPSGWLKDWLPSARNEGAAHIRVTSLTPAEEAELNAGKSVRGDPNASAIVRGVNEWVGTTDPITCSRAAGDSPTALR